MFIRNTHMFSIITQGIRDTYSSNKYSGARRETLKEVMEQRNRKKKITSQDSEDEKNSDTSIDTADSEEIIEQLKKRGTTPGKRFGIRGHIKLKNNTYCFMIINKRTKSTRWWS